MLRAFKIEEEICYKNVENEHESDITAKEICHVSAYHRST